MLLDINPMKPKICKECRNHGTKKNSVTLYCSRPWKQVNLVTGEPDWMVCETERMGYTAACCGKEGRHYERLPTIWEFIREKFSGSPKERN